MKNLDTYIRLFPNCIPVEGASRSVICDLDMNKVVFVPNTLIRVLEMGETKLLRTIYAENKEHTETLDSYFSYLEERGLVYFSAQNENLKLKKISTEWDFPSKISNAIIDISAKNLTGLEKVIEQLEKLNCRHCQIRDFGNNFDPTVYETILNLFHQSTFLSVDLVIPASDRLDVTIFSKFKRLSNIIIFGSEEKKNDIVSGINLVYTDAQLFSSKCCGLINSNYFVTNIATFTESQHYNTCLNRKISIDINGEIKNCPSMIKSYGNIKDTTLQEALEHPDFKKLWNINKDKIHVCKDCEFRHICTDCRAYIEDPEDIYSKPLKCGYNPYTGEWSEWSTNPLKEKAIAYYGLKEEVEEI